MREIALVQRAFRAECPKDCASRHSVIKNILSYFEKYDGSVAYMPPKKKKSGQKREMSKNQLDELMTEKLISEFSQLSIRKLGM